MAKKQTEDTEKTVAEGETSAGPASPPAEPEKIKTIEDHGIGAADPYPTSEAKP